MNILVNGQLREISAGSSLADLLQSMNLQPRMVAVEVNLDVVPRTHHAQHVLQEGDRLEIVTLVGGG